MAMYSLNKKQPQCGKGVWIAESAQVIGDVILGEQTSVWFNAVVRADNEPMHIGVRTNIQDAAVLHSDFGFPLHIGNNVTVGHKAVLHGCTIRDGGLIGIGAVILNGACIGRNCLVAAGALVTEGKEFPDGSLIIGSPAVAKRSLSKEQIQTLQDSACHYVSNAEYYRTGLHKQEPSSSSSSGVKKG